MTLLNGVAIPTWFWLHGWLRKRDEAEPHTREQDRAAGRYRKAWIRHWGREPGTEPPRGKGAEKEQ